MEILVLNSFADGFSIKFYKVAKVNKLESRTIEISQSNTKIIKQQ